MTSPTSFIEIVENRIMSNAARLPVFNTTAARIQQEIGREEPDLRLIEKLIVSDQALTAEVLRFSNSSFYKGLTQVSTVRNAIVRLGINEVSNIVMMVTHENQFRSKDPVLNGVIRKLWQHALGTAMAAHWLARHCGLHGIAHEAFFAGLLHDVGKLFILTVIDDIQHSDQVKVNPSAALLMEVMDDLHTTHGYALMHHWNLPEKYSQVVRDHHTQALEAENYLSLTVRLANKTCNKMGLGLRHDAAWCSWRRRRRANCTSRRSTSPRWRSCWRTPRRPPIKGKGARGQKPLGLRPATPFRQVEVGCEKPQRFCCFQLRASSVERITREPMKYPSGIARIEPTGWIISEGKLLRLDPAEFDPEADRGTVKEYRISEIARYLIHPGPIEIRKRLIGCEVHTARNGARRLLRRLLPARANAEKAFRVGTPRSSCPASS